MLRFVIGLALLLVPGTAVLAQLPAQAPPPCEERLAASEIRRQVGDQVEARYAAEIARRDAELTRVKAALEAAEQRIRLEIPEAPAPTTSPRPGPKRK